MYGEEEVRRGKGRVRLRVKRKGSGFCLGSAAKVRISGRVMARAKAKVWVQA